MAIELELVSAVALVIGEVRERKTGRPRIFRAAELLLIYAAAWMFRYSVRTSCGVL